MRVNELGISRHYSVFLGLQRWLGFSANTVDKWMLLIPAWHWLLIELIGMFLLVFSHTLNCQSRDSKFFFLLLSCLVISIDHESINISIYGFPTTFFSISLSFFLVLHSVYTWLWFIQIRLHKPIGMNIEKSSTVTAFICMKLPQIYH